MALLANLWLTNKYLMAVSKYSISKYEEVPKCIPVDLNVAPSPNLNPATVST